MKKILISIAVIASLLALDSCKKDSLATDFEGFTASIENTLDTKTSLTSDRKVNWVANDQISINGVIFSASPKSDATKANFTKVAGNDPAGPYKAYYPSNIYDVTTATLPSTISYSSSQPFATIPMYAESASKSLSFKNICGVLAVKIKSSDMATVKKIRVSSSNKAMSGEFTVTEGVAVLTSAAQTAMAPVIIDCGNTGVSPTSSGTVFYIAIPAQTYKNIKIELSNDGTNFTKTMSTKKDQDIVVSTNTIYQISFSDNSAEDLSASGTANCYIVSEAGKYKFKTVKGNSTTSVGEVKGVKVLWETFGTATAPKVGELIKADVSYSDGYITFSTNDTYKEGNAVIAAYSDAACTDGNVLWSWHIWLTDKPAEQVYKNYAGTMMDRNLGATSATPGDVHALGLMYQWGRKDPFLSGWQISYTSSSNQQQAASTLSWPSAVSSNTNNGKIAFVVSHPTTFILYNSNNHDWYYTGNSTTDDTRWRTVKTIYDPCPSGWRVPDGGQNGVWSKAFKASSGWKTSSNWDNAHKGMDFSKTDKKLVGDGSVQCWYPAVGDRADGSYSLNGIGIDGSYWSCTPQGRFAYGMDFRNSGSINPVGEYWRADGHSIRCLKD